MRDVSVKYHVVAHATHVHAFPAADLQTLFATSGINLRLTEGEPIASDPTHNPVVDYPRLVQTYESSDTSSGHLIVGLDDPRRTRDVAGELLDLRRRGVAAVYMNSLYIQQEGRDAFLQTAAHELGHMLHLSHDDVASDYKSVMNPAGNRGGEFGFAWQRAHAEAEQKAAEDQPAFFQAPPRALGCYPFALPARVLLNNNSDQELLPWGGRYSRPDNGANDTWQVGTSLRLVPDRARFVEGGPFAFTLRFRNDSRRAVKIPSQIGPQFDTLQLTITRPDGTQYRHRPRSLACSPRLRVLKPGDEITRPFVTTRGQGGAVFPIPGRYVISAVFPAAHAASVPVEVQVAKTKSGPLANPQFRKFIAKGAPSASRRFVKQLDDALDARARLDPLSRSYLALVRAGTVRDLSRAAALRRIALAKSSPAAVRHAAVIRELDAISLARPLDKVSVQKLIDRHLPRDVDHYLAQQLEEFYS